METAVLSVHPAELRDIEAIADLLDELNRFYGATDTTPLAERTVQIAARLFGDMPAAHVLLARDGDDAVGLAA